MKEIQDRPARKKVMWSVLHSIENYKITLQKNNYPRVLMIGDNQETVQLRTQ